MGRVKGIILGILGALIGGAIFGGIAIVTGYLLGLIALISGAIPGFIFGYSARNESKLLRAFVGAVLGFTSILLGYYIIYQTMVISVEVLGITAHVKASSAMSFGEFMGAYIEPLDVLFFILGVGESATLSMREYGG